MLLHFQAHKHLNLKVYLKLTIFFPSTQHSQSHNQLLKIDADSENHFRGNIILELLHS